MLCRHMVDVQMEKLDKFRETPDQVHHIHHFHRVMGQDYISQLIPLLFQTNG
jgi:hypothetical protein